MSVQVKEMNTKQGNVSAGGLAEEGLKGFALSDVTALTSKLAKILAEETGYLRSMQLKKVEALQKEKFQIIRVLEMIKAEMKHNPQLKEQFLDDEVEEFTHVSEMFNDVLMDNHRNLMFAQTVNHTVIEAIRDTLIEQSGSAYYGQAGAEGKGSPRDMSMAINEVI